MKKFLLFIVLLFMPIIVLAEEVKLIDYVKGIAGTANKDTINEIGSTGLAYDDSRDQNLRYVGKEPNNFVSFNGETWRIIGIMNNVKTSTGKTKSLVKLVRAYSIGKYSWDSSAENINTGYGVNEWSKSDIKELLNNGAYYNRSTGKCNVGPFEQTTDCNFKNNGLTTTAKDMITKVVWNTGSNSSNLDYATEKGIPRDFYEFERSNENGKKCDNNNANCNDTVTRTVTWTGEVGLFYPSDYAYATGGMNGTDREACLSAPISWRQYGDASWANTYYSCAQNSWLYNRDTWSWTMSPRVRAWEGPYSGWDGAATEIFYVNYTGYVDSHHAAADQTEGIGEVYPTVYLDENVLYMDGDGSKNNPIKLGMYVKDEITINISQTVSISDIIKTDTKRMYWNIDGDNVSVTNGKILGVKIGTAVLTTEKDDTTYFIKVNVVNKKEIINPETNSGQVILIIVSVTALLSALLLLNKKHQYE